MASIMQMHPMNASYSCHCPSVVLKCNFSKNPTKAFWTVLINGTDTQVVTTSTPGHTVDMSKVQDGILYLEVNNTKYSEGNHYSCTAEYPDNEPELSGLFPIPVVESE